MALIGFLRGQFHIQLRLTLSATTMPTAISMTAATISSTSQLTSRSLKPTSWTTSLPWQVPQMIPSQTAASWRAAWATWNWTWAEWNAYRRTLLCSHSEINWKRLLAYCLKRLSKVHTQWTPPNL